jgi:hypothetical protein
MFGFHRAQVPDLHTLLIAAVDFKGQRVVAQVRLRRRSLGRAPRSMTLPAHAYIFIITHVPPHNNNNLVQNDTLLPRLD